MFEWPTIVGATSTHLPGAAPWVQWCSAEEVPVKLPCGDFFQSNRGTSQGEPEGPLKSALVIGDAMRKAKSETSNHGLASMVDKWFIDDGQLFMHPMSADGHLRLLDKHLEAAGASRGLVSRGDKIKSNARLLCPASCVSEFEGWATEYVRDSSRVSNGAEAVTLLGTIHGGVVDQSAHFSWLVT